MNDSMAGSPFAPSIASGGAALAELGVTEAQAAEQPVEVEAPVGDAREMRVAQQVVAAVDVERAADGAGQKGDLVPAVDELGDPPGQRRIATLQDLMHLAVRVEHDAHRPVFVTRRVRHRLLEQVRKRTVPEVVEERGGERFARPLGGDALPEREARRESRAAVRMKRVITMRDADGVREARVIGARVGERCEARAGGRGAGAAPRRSRAARHDGSLVRFERNQAVDGITQDHRGIRVFAAAQTWAGARGQG